MIPFSFVTGKTDWTPVYRFTLPLNPSESALLQKKREKGPAELEFSMMGEVNLTDAPIMVLSESEIKSILSTGKLPEKEATKTPQRMNPDSYYILKEESDHSFYVFMLKDYSPKNAWQQIAYVRIPDGKSWKKNSDLTALLNAPKAKTLQPSRKRRRTLIWRGRRWSRHGTKTLVSVKRMRNAPGRRDRKRN